MPVSLRSSLMSCRLLEQERHTDSDQETNDEKQQCEAAGLETFRRLLVHYGVFYRMTSPLDNEGTDHNDR